MKLCHCIINWKGTAYIQHEQSGICLQDFWYLLLFLFSRDGMNQFLQNQDCLLIVFPLKAAHAVQIQKICFPPSHLVGTPEHGVRFPSIPPHMICLCQLALIMELFRISLHQLFICPDAFPCLSIQYAAPCIHIEKALNLFIILHSLLGSQGCLGEITFLHQPLNLVIHTQGKFIICRKFKLDAVFRLILFLYEAFVCRPDFLKPFRILLGGIFFYQFKICLFYCFFIRIFIYAKYFIIYSHCHSPT